MLFMFKPEKVKLNIFIARIKLIYKEHSKMNYVHDLNAIKKIGGGVMNKKTVPYGH